MTTGSVRERAGTCRRIATTGGTNTTWRVYDANGGSLPPSVIGRRYPFQGREYSWATHAATGGTGLYYFRARWYDPVTGRWLSNDPIGISGGLNQYAFCANNPVMFVDPEGKLGIMEVSVAVGTGLFLRAAFTEYQLNKPGGPFATTYVPGAPAFFVGSNFANLTQAGKYVVLHHEYIHMLWGGEYEVYIVSYNTAYMMLKSNRYIDGRCLTNEEFDELVKFYNKSAQMIEYYEKPFLKRLWHRINEELFGGLL